jgi:hypothetical protein
MNSKSRFVVTVLFAALALPIAAFAAKGDKKKDKADALPSFTSIDKDGDHAVTEEEFLAANKEKLGETGAKSRFAMLDKNHDGKLTQEEYDAGSVTTKKRGKKKNAE